MKKLILLSFLIAAAAHAQTQVQGTCTITVPATSLPAGMTFDGTTLSVPKIKLGGQTLAPGTYNLVVTDNAGNSQWALVQPSTGGVTPTFVAVVIPAGKVAAIGGIVDVPYSIPAGKHVISVEPSANPGSWLVTHYAGYIRLINIMTAAQTTKVMTVTVGYE